MLNLTPVYQHFDASVKNICLCETPHSFCAGIVYLMIFNIARRAGQVDRTVAKETARQSRRDGGGVSVVSSAEDVSTEHSTGEVGAGGV